LPGTSRSLTQVTTRALQSTNRSPLVDFITQGTASLMPDDHRPAPVAPLARRDGNASSGRRVSPRSLEARGM
jgi:hypothetical protein